MTVLRHQKDRLAQEAEWLAIELRRLTLRLEQGHRDGKVMPGWRVGLVGGICDLTPHSSV